MLVIDKRSDHIVGIISNMLTADHLHLCPFSPGSALRGAGAVHTLLIPGSLLQLCVLGGGGGGGRGVCGGCLLQLHLLIPACYS